MTSTNKPTLAVIFGGRSGEHAVSLASARSVLGAVRSDKYTIVQIGITTDGQWWSGADALGALERGDISGLTPVTLLPDPHRPGLYAAQPGEPLHRLAEIDVVFPVLHGTYGEDGTLQGLLELGDYAYVGAGVVGSAVGMDKAIFKHVMQANGLPIVAWDLVLRSDLQKDLPAVVKRLEGISGYPLFVKPANLGSSVGITKCRTASDLMEGLLEAAQFDRRIIVERGVANAREIEVSVLGNDHPLASIPGEIRPEADFYSYEAKYHDDRSALFIPAPIDPALLAKVRKLAVQVYELVDCAGMARVDFLLDDDSGELFVNEINTIPGFTRISMYPKLWDATGLSYPDLLDRLIELALERQADRRQTRHTRQ